MTITAALLARKVRLPALAVRRAAWGAEHNAVYVVDGAMWYRRFPNAYGWPWKPTLEDLVADDWMIVPTSIFGAAA